MSSHKKFLPTHPKIVKKISTPNAIPSLTFRSNQSDIKDLHKNMDGEEHQELVGEIMRKQENMVAELEYSLQQIINQNRVLEESVKYYDNQKELENIRRKIEESKQEQQQLIRKIENCQKVQQTTTPEEYYLWQKKKKTDEFNRKIEEAFHENHEERNNLLEVCSHSEQKIKEQKNQIMFLMEELDKLKNGESESDKLTETPEVDQEEFDKLKQDCKDLSSSIDIMKESNEILSSQLEERIEPIQKSLRTTFFNYKSGLLKDLQTTKRQVEDGDPEPPIPNQKDSKPSDIIQEYEKKIGQIKFQVTPEQAQEIEDIIEPFDWKSFQWEQYAVPSETLKETEGAFTAYQQIYSQKEEYDKRIQKLEEEILKTVTDTMQYQQRIMELEGLISKLLRLSMSMSLK